MSTPRAAVATLPSAPPERAPLRILIVEDDLVDRMACRRAFGSDPEHAFTLLEADSGQDGLQLLAGDAPDCILLDYHLPDMTGLEFLARMPDAAALAIPVMMLTGADSAAVAAEAMRQGARDYLVKDSERRYLALLPGAIGRMLREQGLIDDKRRLEAQFRTLVEQIQAITYTAALAPAQSLLYISPQIRMLGFTPDEWLATPQLHARQLHPDDRAGAMQAIDAHRASGAPLRLDYRMLTRAGDVVWFRDEATGVCDDAGKLLFIQGILVDITPNKLAEEALRQSQDELRRLSAHQEKLKEHERKRIAQEIHDELGGLLTGIKAYISVSIERAELAGQAADPLLIDAAGLAKDAIETVRKVIIDLRPSVLDQLGVWAALEWYADQIEKRSGVACTCSIEAQVAALELDAETSTMLFRVVQEALTNVVRHADAARVTIELSLQGDALLLTIIDDGKGIDADGLLDRESWGILGMLERTRHFGGVLKISGKAGLGTTLCLQLPLEHALDG